MGITEKATLLHQLRARLPSLTKDRPNATTRAQRESVQGKPCAKCGNQTERQVAGHKEALVKEWHGTGTIDKVKMRSIDAVQPECPTCSSQEGAEMSRFSRSMNETIESGSE